MRRVAAVEYDVFRTLRDHVEPLTKVYFQKFSFPAHLRVSFVTVLTKQFDRKILYQM